MGSAPEIGTEVATCGYEWAYGCEGGTGKAAPLLSITHLQDLDLGGVGGPDVEALQVGLKHTLAQESSASALSSKAIPPLLGPCILPATSQSSHLQFLPSSLSDLAGSFFTGLSSLRNPRDPGLPSPSASGASP